MAGSVIRLRAVEGDARDELMRWAQQFFAESRYSPQPYSVERTLSTLSTVAADPYGMLLWLPGRGVAIGVVRASPWGDFMEAIPGPLYVTPEHRGSSAGARLLAAYVTLARALGATVVDAEHISGVPCAATRLYERFGFTQCGTLWTRN